MRQPLFLPPSPCCLLSHPNRVHQPVTATSRTASPGCSRGAADSRARAGNGPAWGVGGRARTRGAGRAARRPPGFRRRPGPAAPRRARRGSKGSPSSRACSGAARRPGRAHTSPRRTSAPARSSPGRSRAAGRGTGASSHNTSLARLSNREGRGAAVPELTFFVGLFITMPLESDAFPLNLTPGSDKIRGLSQEVSP